MFLTYPLYVRNIPTFGQKLGLKRIVSFFSFVTFLLIINVFFYAYNVLHGMNLSILKWEFSARKRASMKS